MLGGLELSPTEKVRVDKTLIREQLAAVSVFSALEFLADSASHVGRMVLVATELLYLSPEVTTFVWS